MFKWLVVSVFCALFACSGNGTIGGIKIPTDTGTQDTVVDTKADAWSMDTIHDSTDANDATEWNREILPNPEPSTASLFGRSLAASSNGKVLAAGFKASSDNDSYAVRLFQRITVDEPWNDGDTLTRPSGSRWFGSDLAINHDGTLLVVADPQADTFGRVSVYRRQDGIWNFIQHLPRPDAGFFFGVHVAVTPDGTTIAVSCPSSGAANASPKVVLYTMVTDEWRIHTTLLSTHLGGIGMALSISDDGHRVVVGDPESGTERKGGVVVFDFNESNQEWSDGILIQRQLEGNDFGIGLAMSGNGNTLIVGDRQNMIKDGEAIYVYRYISGSWDNGTAIPRPLGAHDFGRGGMVLNENGTQLAISGLSQSSTTTVSGIWLYALDSSHGSLSHFFAPQENNSGSFGLAVASSNDFRHIYVSDPHYGENRTGQVAEYRLTPFNE